ncbi:transient receptor potential cation channel subfamily M member 5 [Solea solea]|uniref:transient receptor potential cation channel subfamily M member 5 n=1 Tax=Solea solea TaxID=90069 RepID=UPI00272C4EC9|nr:transient receptor potential cation channel subfamily M member 5 [Solea solea]XP_058484703.1 transient receptor potential cation channel subfamily M member 5 [Solea solea]XP_058484704.1 transient receptor potential cation channel subfamily M member 5 [Solea solea]XP_058484706.1 transient receptor potential cation channel subfamily M member 5 [Solea solea]
MQERKDIPLGTLQPQTRCLRCGDVLQWSQEHSVLLGCPCCSAVDKTLENVTRGLASRVNQEKSHWAAGRVGDIDFTGSTKTRGKFMRVCSDTDPVLIYQMLTEEWGLAPPHLVVALVGGDELAQMKPWLRDTLRKGLVKAAQSTGAWILTNGLRFGITKHLGQAVRDHSLASTSSKIRVVAIGIAPWNMIHNREALLTAKVDEPAAYKPHDLPHGSVYSLDSHHSHFVLVEEDPSRPGATSEMRVKLLKHISLQRTGYGGAGSFEIPVLCLLVHGEPKILKRMYKGIGNSTPWLILAGSGGVADILVTLMNRGCWDTDSVHELLLDTFPNAHHSTDISNWVKLIQKILDHGHLLTVHDPEQESSELDTVILKALVKACKSQSQEAQDFLDELKLAVAWNRVDIAKSDIFNGDVEWKACDLEEVMMDALINDKPDFVRLFVDNGVNLGEFLTYGRLQELYWSVSEKSLLHNLLLKKYEEKQILLGAARTPGPPGHHPPEQGKPRFTLYEVAKVLKDFLHDSCKGFYQKIPTEKPAKGRLFHQQKNLAELEERCEHPWRDLFLWAVLQNRQQMANYFWAMGPEAVAAALAGCKILKEMARLESEAESARSMKEAKYEQFALDVFGECYSNSEDRAYALLVRRTHCWSKSTVLNLATEADAKSFFAHDGVQALLTKIWWGAMRTDTAISKLVVSFFCPALIWTNLIKFSDEELDHRNGREQFVEQDSLDTEKALLLTDDDDDPLDPAPGDPAAQSCASVWWRFLLRRWRRFWSAPVTVFLGNVIMYFAFLFLFTYVLLLDFRPPPPAGPGAPELILYFWVFTLVLEELRQSFFTDEEMSILKKFKLYLEDNWNKCDIVAILLFVVGVSCRMANHTYEAGRTVLAIDFMVFTLRLIHIFAIHKQLGPKIIIVERMMKDVFFFLFFLSVWMIAYGVATQALLHPNDPRIDWVFRRALYRPYLHIFGQIPLEEIDAARMPEINCTNDSEEIISGLRPPCPNVYANWLVILLLVIFLLVTNVLLLNLLIAMFSYTFQVVQGNTDIFWKFQRYNLIVEYHSRPALAPPFIIISHLSQILFSLVKQPESKQEHLERELPVGLDQRLITWETVQKENYLAKLERQHWESSEERLKSTSSKVQSLLRIVGGVKDQEKRLASMEAQIRYCGEVLSWMAECFAQSTLKCGKEAPNVPISLTGYKASISNDACQSQPEKDVKQERGEDGTGHPGYGANKKFPYIDE